MLGISAQLAVGAVARQNGLGLVKYGLLNAIAGCWPG
jgi:hypothetical protein